MIQVFILSASVIFIYMTLFFLLAQALKDNSIVDIGWGIGFIILSATLLYNSEVISVHQWISFCLILLWGLRLSLHIFLRNHGKHEDFRYANWRKEWGKYVVIRSFLQVFMLQGFFMFIIALPLMIVKIGEQTSLQWTDYVGLIIWLIGFYFEAVGDYQMVQFKKNPANKGKFITSGLWKYTRHPNYFGECAMWWGIFIISISAGNAYVSIISPIVLTWLLTRVSGVPMLEKKYVGNKEFEEYAQKTNAFIPWFPKK
jgi:steroid 5-alpha reductase family enzyme